MRREAIKHTPGPWFSAYDDNGFYEIGSESVSLRLAFTYGEGETDEANARLIAAAPDLLDVVKEANAELERLNDPRGFVSMRQMRIMEKARAAIAKATGEKS